MAAETSADVTGLAPVRGELDLIAGYTLLRQHRRFILLCGAVCFVLMVLAMLFAKPRFSSSTSIVIPQHNSAASALKAQLDAIASPVDLAGGGYEIYADILKSRTVLDRVIADQHLMDVYKTKDLPRAEAILSTRTLIATQSEGLVTVTVQDEDKDRVAAIANSYIRQLDAADSMLVLTTVGRERLFLERELASQKQQMEASEAALARTTEGMRGLPPQSQASAGVSALETTRAELVAAQVKLSALLTGETDANPEVVRQRSEVGRLSAQLQSLQHGEGNDITGTPTSQMPGQTLEYQRAERDVKFNEGLYTLLANEYEQAKLEEAKDPNVVQVLDVAVPATHKSWPPRTVYCAIAALAGLVLGMMLVLVKAFYLKFRETHDLRRRLAE